MDLVRTNANTDGGLIYARGAIGLQEFAYDLHLEVIGA